MNLPFTVEQFLGVFKSYNESIFPAQFFAYALGMACVYFLFKSSKFSARAIVATLAAFWIWIGMIYHITFFTEINPAAYGFGVLFTIQGLILLFIAMFKKDLEISYKKDIKSVVGIVLIAYSMVIYPLIGYFTGHVYPSAPVFGLTPCPATIFTFGVFLQSRSLLNFKVLTIPLIWSIIGYTAAFTLGVPEDTGLLAAGILGAAFAVARIKMDKAKKKSQILST